MSVHLSLLLQRSLHSHVTTVLNMQVLREELKCSLPVELVWHSAHEMDNATLAALRKHFGPIIGISLSSLPWPAHHRAKEVVQ
jgi:hypothetical protein